MAKHVSCPSCGLANIPERTACKQCRAPLYVAPAQPFTELIERRQLEFLVDTTANWPIDAAYRAPYVERLAVLKEHDIPATPSPPYTESQSATAEAAVAPLAEPIAPASLAPAEQWSTGQIKGRSGAR